MLQDRPSIRSDYRLENTTFTTWLVCVLVATFLVELLAESGLLVPLSTLNNWLTLSIQGIREGTWWTISTYWLFHSTNNLLHLGIVVAGLILLSGKLAGLLGLMRFSLVFGCGLVAGALVWTVANWQRGGNLTGATAGVCALLAIYSLLRSEDSVEFLLLFVPVRFKIRHLAILLVTLDLTGLLLVDILERPLPFAYTPISHLGGWAAGWICYRLFHYWPMGGSSFDKGDFTGLHGSLSCRDSSKESEAFPQGPPVQREPSLSSVRSEVDRLLDKINSQGLGALTPDERRTLSEAKTHLSRR